MSKFLVCHSGQHTSYNNEENISFSIIRSFGAMGYETLLGTILFVSYLYIPVKDEEALFEIFIIVPPFRLQHLLACGNENL